MEKELPDKEHHAMTTVALQALGQAAFLISTLIFGRRLRENPTKERAEKTSRVLHLVYWIGFGLPTLIGVFRPGLARFDRMLGIPSLPASWTTRALGAVLFAAGTALAAASIRALRLSGDGSLAFQLTRRVVHDDIYQRTRNPMSLGLYLECVGIGLALKSTYLTLASLVAVIPAHVFYLKHFEEMELELRFGQPYVEYRDRVPFLIPKPGTFAGGVPED